MSSRRNAALALAGIPLAATANSSTNAVPNLKIDPPLPLSETAVRIISYTIYAESRGESFEGKKAVAAVIHTRSKLKLISLAEVCLQDQQFSCWNTLQTVPEYYANGTGFKPADLKARGHCYGLAWLLIAGQVKWEFLTHFYNPSKASPEWRHELSGTRMIGNHIFGYIN